MIINVGFTANDSVMSALILKVNFIKKGRVGLFISLFREHLLNRLLNENNENNVKRMLQEFIVKLYICLFAPVILPSLPSLSSLPIEFIGQEGIDYNLSSSVDFHIDLCDNIKNNDDIVLEEIFQYYRQNQNTDLIFVVVNDNNDNINTYIELAEEGSESKLEYALRDVLVD